MNIIINSTSETQTHVNTSLTINKKKIYTSLSKDGLYANVVMCNASHNAYRGSGKHFHGKDASQQAMCNYKSPEAKAAIEYTVGLLN